MIKLYAPKLFYCQNPLFAPDKSDLTEIKSLFEKAVAKSELINERACSKTLLQLYSLYNQATKGDIDLDMLLHSSDTETKAKYNAWASLRGKSIRDAQSEYIMLVHELMA